MSILESVKKLKVFYELYIAALELIKCVEQLVRCKLSGLLFWTPLKDSLQFWDSLYDI